MSESGNLNISISDFLRLIEDIAVAHGFEVSREVYVEGLSLYNHRFDALLQKSSLKILVDLPQGVFEFLASLAKRVDVLEYKFLTVVHEGTLTKILPELEEHKNKTALEEQSIVIYRGVEDLREKLEIYFKNLATETPPETSQPL
ncbi:MAG: hypothetical protein ABWK01_03390 [Infirmifilum sp.]